LISHDAVVEASLRIIDREGLDAFSLPRLARELNVQTPSLYYHFRDRADILRTVARAIVLESRVPAPDACRTWVDWFVGISLSFRRAVLSHRNAAPILLEFMPRDVLIWNYELGVQILAAVGVPPEARIGVIDGLDTLTLGASLAEAARSPARAGQVFASVDADAEPMLADALAANTRTAEQLFADSIRSFLRGAVPGVPPDVPAPRALIARYRDTRAAAASHDGLDGSGLPAAHLAAENERLGGLRRRRRSSSRRRQPHRLGRAETGIPWR
jgi:AcrR family transcriptional regulator